MPTLPRALSRLSRQFEDSREELGEALICSSNPKEVRLGKMLLSRHMDHEDSLNRLSIGGMAHRLGVDYKQIMTAFQQYKKLQAIVNIAREMPAVASDIAADARNKLVTCTACKGSGRIIISSDPESPITTEMCIPCEGTGKVVQRGDKDARKQMLEVMELAGRGAIAVDNRGGQMVVTSEGSLENMLKQSRTQPRGGANVEGAGSRIVEMDGADAMEDAQP
jgi:hypothetical protein